MGHRLTGYDCEEATGITNLEIENSCNINKMTRQPFNQKLTLLQHNPVTTVDGYSCAKIVSTFDVYCGSFSHQKMADIPKIEVRENVNPRECKLMVGLLKYTSAGGNTVDLKMDSENLIYSTPIGEFGESNHNIACEGQKVKIGGKIVESIVEMKQVKIILRKEKLRWKGKQGESQSEHVKLPRQCNIGDEGCETATRTYLWSLPENMCPLELVRDVQGRMEGNVFIDEKSLIRLEVKQPFTAEFLGCQSLELYKTQYENLFVMNTEDLKTKLPSVTQTAIDLEEYINARDDFLAAEMENKMDWLKNNQATGVCQQELRWTNQQDQIVKIGNTEGTFGRIRGEVITLMTCKKVEVEPIEGVKCYLELPVAYKQKTYYLEPTTRRLKKYGTELPCEPLLAAQFKTKQDKWITMTPKIHMVSAPQNFKLITSNLTHHLDMSNGGIFTHQQLQKWELATSFPDYHQALGRRITTQACQEEGCALNHVDTMGQMREFLKEGLQKLSIGHYLWSVLQNIGQVTSVLVAVIWIGQIIWRLVLCGQICKTDGIQPACGLCGLFFTKDQLLAKEYYSMKQT